jgi:His-Xaa-Ser repeat protein HxsA
MAIRQRYADSSTIDSVVVDVQKELAREGYYRGSIDGIVGPTTRSAIATYQRAHGLPVNGRINTQLIDSLGLS